MGRRRHATPAFFDKDADVLVWVTTASNKKADAEKILAAVLRH